MTTREQSIKWWNDEPTEIREMYSQQYFKRVWVNLTGSEIEEIWRKETQTENIYLNRLKEQYKTIESGSKANKQLRQTRYFAMREFCLDTQLVSFNDIEQMEFEVNQSFS